MNLFAQVAREATSLSPLIEKRTKMPISDIIEKYPDGINVTGFDLIDGTDNDGNPTTYPVIVFAEEDDKFAFGGLVMKNVCHAWLAHFEGDIDTCNAALKANGGVKLKFTRDKTKKGREVTKVEVVTS